MGYGAIQDETVTGQIHEVALKQGHSFCGCCCDMRRAAIICNIIGCAQAIISILIELKAIGSISAMAFDDDQMIKIMDPEVAVLYHAVAFAICSFFFFAMGIYGAKQYKLWAVIATTIWYGIAVMISFSILNIIGAILSAVCLYPHAVLWIEMQKGIIAEDTYSTRELQSCCCV